MAERGLNDEEQMVASLKALLQSGDREEQFVSDYQTKYVPTAIALRHELIQRVPLPARVGEDAGQKGDTTFEMYEVADDLDALANQLPADHDTRSRTPEK
jgi:hypothetical protein